MNIKKRTKEYLFIAVAAVGMLAVGLFFTYMDMTSLQGWSFEFWDCLFSGRISELHTVFVENYRKLPHVSCGGNFIWLIPIALWNLPLWVLNEICFHYIELPQWMTLWTKLLYLGAVIIMAVEVTRIVDAGKKRNKSIFLFCIGSFEVILSTMYAGQDEILYLALFIVAMRCYKEQKYNAFLVCGFLSAIMCPIMLIPLLTLVLDIQKLWLSIAMLLGTGVIGAVYQLIVKNDEWFWYYHTSGLVVIDDMIGKNTWKSPLGDVAFFFVAVIIIFYIALFIPTFEKEREKEKIQLACISMIVVSFFSTQVFYRWLLYVPFAIILIYLNGNISIKEVVFCALSYLRSYWVLGQIYVMDSDYCSSFANRERGKWLYAEMNNRIESLKYMEKLLVPTMYAMIAIFLYNCIKENKANNHELSIISAVAKTVYALFPIGAVILFWMIC